MKLLHIIACAAPLLAGACAAQPRYASEALSLKTTAHSDSKPELPTKVLAKAKTLCLKVDSRFLVKTLVESQLEVDLKALLEKARGVEVRTSACKPELTLYIQDAGEVEKGDLERFLSEGPGTEASFGTYQSDVSTDGQPGMGLGGIIGFIAKGVAEHASVDANTKFGAVLDITVQGQRYRLIVWTPFVAPNPRAKVWGQVERKVLELF